MSSTGHLILADEFIQLGVSDAFKEMFDVVIQLGAILAVVVIFWNKLWPFQNDRRAQGLERWCRMDVWQMWFRVFVAVLPSVVLGLPLDDWLTEHFHNPPVIAVMLILYGVLFIWMENTIGKQRPRVKRINQINYRIALFIGCLLYTSKASSPTAASPCGRTKKPWRTCAFPGSSAARSSSARILTKCGTCLLYTSCETASTENMGVLWSDCPALALSLIHI